MSAIGGPNVIDDGLVLALDAGNHISYPGSGTVWTDLSGRGNNGTLTNGPTYNSENGGSLVFDGSDDYVLTSTNTAFGTGNFTIDIWFKPNGSQSTNSSLLCIASGLASTNWQIDFSSNILRFFVDNTPTLVTSTYTVSDTWANVTVVRESTSTNGLKIYINGELNIQGTVANNFSQVVGYRIGINRGLSVPFRGNIAITRVYNIPFTQSDVLQNYNATKGRFGL
jgi:hypothetical protein